MPNCNKTRLYHHIVDKTVPNTVKSAEITEVTLHPDICPSTLVTVVDIPSDSRCHQNVAEIAKTATSVIFLRNSGIQDAEAAKLLSELLNMKFSYKKVVFYVQNFEVKFKKLLIKNLEILTGNEDMSVLDKIISFDDDYLCFITGENKQLEKQEQDNNDSKQQEQSGEDKMEKKLEEFELKVIMGQELQ